MPPAARIGDQTYGVCTGHEPPITIGGIVLGPGASDVLTENEVASVLGDTVLADCGHTGTLIAGSDTVLADNLSRERLGDEFVGTYSGTIITGAETVEVG